MWAVNDSCPQERPWDGYCRNKFQTQPTFKKSIATGKLSSHPLQKRKIPKRPQDKMLNIPNYSRRNANLKDNKKSTSDHQELDLRGWGPLPHIAPAPTMCNSLPYVIVFDFILYLGPQFIWNL